MLVHLKKSAGTFADDGVSGVIISSGAGGGIITGGTAGDGCFEVAQAATSISGSSSEALLFHGMSMCNSIVGYGERALAQSVGFAFDARGLVCFRLVCGQRALALRTSLDVPTDARCEGNGEGRSP